MLMARASVVKDSSASFQTYQATMAAKRRQEHQRRVVQPLPQARREVRQEDVDAHVGAGGQAEGERPRPADGQRVAADLVGRRRRHAHELAPEHVGGDVEGGQEEEGAAEIRHSGRHPIEDPEEPPREGAAPERAPPERPASSRPGAVARRSVTGS
jgi:hypothetical protein